MYKNEYFIDKLDDNKLLNLEELRAMYEEYILPEELANGNTATRFNSWLYDCLYIAKDLESVLYFAECDEDGEVINNEMYDEPADVPRENSDGLYVAVGERFDYLLP